MSQGSSPAALYRRTLAEARRYWWHIAGMTLVSLLATPIGLLKPLPLAVAIDSVIGGEPLPGFLQPFAPTGDDGALVFVAALVVTVALLTALQGLTSQVLRTWVGQRLVLDIRGRLFRHAQTLSLGYHDRTGTSDSVYRIQYDASAVKGLAINGLIPFVSSMVKVAAMLYVTLRIDARLALVAMVVCPLLFVCLRLYGHRLRGGWTRVTSMDAASMGIAQEVLAGVRVVKAFGREDHEHRRYVDQAQRKIRARTRLAFSESGLSLLIGLITAGGTATILYLGVSSVLAGSLSLGDLTLVMGYLSQLYGPIEKMSEKIGEVQSSLVGAERAFALFDQAPGVAERPGAMPLRRARGEVVLDDVTFAYDDGAPALEHVSLAVPAGTRVGIAGATGAGKTTLVSLLLRFYDPTGGRILLDGVDLRDYRLADLRDQFAVVLQEPLLFSTSIAENIAYARPGASPAAVVAAATAAHAHDFISALPDGYETLVGERGMRLSGGERQRISLARAFLKDAPMLILDEPTSSVDPATERAIVTASEALMAGRTAFLIAHRPSTLTHCTLRLRIEHGRLASVEQVGSGAD